jgi:hypothetical protein
MVKRRVPREPIVAIIRDARDASRDYYIPYSEAKLLYEKGKLGFDETNHCYCHPIIQDNQP